MASPFASSTGGNQTHFSKGLLPDNTMLSFEMCASIWFDRARALKEASQLGPTLLFPFPSSPENPSSKQLLPTESQVLRNGTILNIVAVLSVQFFIDRPENFANALPAILNNCITNISTH